MSVAIVKINSRQCVVGSNDERASEQEEIAVPQIYIYMCVCVCVCMRACIYRSNSLVACKLSSLPVRGECTFSSSRPFGFRD